MMPPPTDSSPARPFSKDSEWRQFLVPAAEQVWFVTFFTLATIVGWLVAGIFHEVIQRNLAIVLPEALPLQQILAQPGLNQLTIGLWTGAIVGVTQWLILRAYIPNLMWVVTTSIGWGLASVVAMGWAHWVPPLLATAAFVWLGAIQWFVIRQYVRQGGWWVFIPILPSVLVFGLFQILDWGLRTIGIEVATSSTEQLILFLVLEIIRILALGLLQATGLCAFRRRINPGTTRTRQASPLVSAPKITDAQQVHRLSQILYDTIDRHWQQEISCDQELIYLVGMTEQADIVTYRPVNQGAIDYDGAIPLSDLVERDRHLPEQHLLYTPLARFRVVFTPTGVLKVSPW